MSAPFRVVSFEELEDIVNRHKVIHTPVFHALIRQEHFATGERKERVSSWIREYLRRSLLYPPLVRLLATNPSRRGLEGIEQPDPV